MWNLWDLDQQFSRLVGAKLVQVAFGKQCMEATAMGEERAGAVPGGGCGVEKIV